MAVTEGATAESRADGYPAPYGVAYDVTDAVAVIELRGPASGNTLDTHLRSGLLMAARRLTTDTARGVRAALITARGKHFCVGQDLREHARLLKTAPATAFATIPNDYNPLVKELNALPVPLVVAVEGACVGAGLGIALCADVRVAAEGARFATAFTSIGLASDSGVARALARQLGPSRAAGLMLLGDQFSARDAEHWGLVHRVVGDGTAAAEGLALARSLAAGPTAAHREAKALLRSAATTPLPAALEREAVIQRRLGATDDHHEAVAAFLERRSPAFRGH
ncbi:enoyl-CoA hydratase/isomerase family protein [Streptomyces sp. V4I2]|uniref:enoyl-CoA hydratase/isomerase family protein n=1 Tax=Streptomyces sp. V4I2 TaxID=3042280 RepID=UPI0027883844|nr:enoyl-CoA hydratase-related protein [Streptomyces sp. V4I2]MDQ1050994.1 2-(1,2-epoxy-1,2-dihydrophenyl)acetyl-CoA isomerase [Streptomyces sp. V4I2]